MSTKPVIIVGAGLVGLAAALELARFDVPSVVLEQRDSTSHHPKTRNFNTRVAEESTKSLETIRGTTLSARRLLG